MMGVSMALSFEALAAKNVPTKTLWRKVCCFLYCIPISARIECYSCTGPAPNFYSFLARNVPC